MNDFQKYRDFGTKLACDKQLRIYKNKIYSLRSKFHTARKQSKVIELKLEELLYKKLPTNQKTFDISTLETTSFIKKITEPEVIEIPYILAEILVPQTNIESEPNPDDLSDIASDYINQAIKSLQMRADNSIDDVFSFLDNLTPFFTSPIYIETFQLLDKLNHYIISTGFISLYEDQKEEYKILEGYCKCDLSSILNDSFLWTKYEEDFILPININDSKIKLVKFFENPTQSQKEKLNRIEVDYHLYIEQRKRVLDKLKEMIGDISDELNPVILAQSLI